MSDIKIRLEAAREERRKLEKKIAAMAVDVFSEEVKKLFEKHPVLQSFSWTQYTPYFNDGDVCEFGVNRDYITLESVNGEIDDEFSLWSAEREIKEGKRQKWDSVNRTYVTEPYTPSLLDFAGIDTCNFLKEFEENDFLVMFGDHVRVTVKRDGSVDTDDYEHE